MTVPEIFRVVITSDFAPDQYRELLSGSLPMDQLQPMHIFDPRDTSVPTLVADAAHDESHPV